MKRAAKCFHRVLKKKILGSECVASRGRHPATFEDERCRAQINLIFCNSTNMRASSNAYTLFNQMVRDTFTRVLRPAAQSIRDFFIINVFFKMFIKLKMCYTSGVACLRQLFSNFSLQKDP